ncbi:MAG: MATE family efflux transporter [Oscillospiraceae bacterium]
MNEQIQNPLGTEKISRLLVRFAIPSVIGMVVNALYNIVDQVFIGWGVGYLGNAATNVAFPLVTLSVALSLLFGLGGASKESMELGAGEQEKAEQTVGNVIMLLIISGLLLFFVGLIFFEPMLLAFGSTELVLPYARVYVYTALFGLPFSIFNIGFSSIIRADGSPVYAMVSIVTGAILNIGLDALFLYGFGWGVFGVAFATALSQFVSFCISIAYLPRMKQVRITRKTLRIRPKVAFNICALGFAPFANQVSMAVVQIALNNSLTFYGAQSVYGKDIPLACAGLITKVNTIMMAFVIGLAQSNQPIAGFNYGAKQYDRVRQSFRYAVVAATLFSILAFFAFQLLPRQIIGLFGEGSEEYYQFSIRYFRIFLMMTLFNGIQPVTSNFFTAIGKAGKGALLALTRQIIFLLPLILILPLFWGIDGILFAGPVADFSAALLSVVLVRQQMNQFPEYQRLSERHATGEI